MIYYDFFEKEKLLIIRYDGEITESMLLDFIPFIFKEIDKFPLSFVLNDFRKSIFKFDLDRLRNIVNIRTEKAIGAPEFNAVYLIDNIHQTTYTVLYNEISNETYPNINICSTLELAINLLGMDLSISELEANISSLKYLFKDYKNE